jgi:hypothetical protein
MMEVLIGVISGLIGLGLLSLVTLIIYKLAIGKGKAPDIPFLTITVIMVVTGAFFSLLSYRLLLNRGARVGGGLLSPSGWRVLGSIFVVLAIALAGAAIWRHQWGQLAAPVFGVVFAVWCFWTAKRYSI